MSATGAVVSCKSPAEKAGQNRVRVKGLEPIRRKAPDPKSGLSTNSNTPADGIAKVLIFYEFHASPAFTGRRAGEAEPKALGAGADGGDVGLVEAAQQQVAAAL